MREGREGGSLKSLNLPLDSPSRLFAFRRCIGFAHDVCTCNITLRFFIRQELVSAVANGLSAHRSLQPSILPIIEWASFPYLETRSSPFFHCRLSSPSRLLPAKIGAYN